MNTDQAQAVYDILVEHGGACETWRHDFVYSTQRPGFSEYRFQGIFGFGGKFWDNGGWYVNMYLEDATDERLQAQTLINKKLSELHARVD